MSHIQIRLSEVSVDGFISLYCRSTLIMKADGRKVMIYVINRALYTPNCIFLQLKCLLYIYSTFTPRKLTHKLPNNITSAERNTSHTTFILTAEPVMITPDMMTQVCWKKRSKVVTLQPTIAAIITGGIMIASIQLLHSGRIMAPSLYLRKCSPDEETDENYHTGVQRTCKITVIVPVWCSISCTFLIVEF